MSAELIAPDGSNVFEAVQVVYDIAHMSMDWGSGFLDNEEMETVVRFAVAMGFQVPDIPTNGPMVEVARKFPEHYEIKPNRWGHERIYPIKKP